MIVVGCGGIAPAHLKPLVADARARIVGLCDPDRAAAQQLADQFGIRPQIETDIDRLLAHVEADAAVVLTPTHLHFEHVQQLRAAGLPVLCEKPLAETRERILELVQDIQRGGPPVSIAYQRRTWSTYRTIRREVLSGKYGPVRAVTSLANERWIQVYHSTWRDDAQRNPGGFVGDAGSHKVDMLFYTTGLLPESVMAVSDRRGHQVDVVTNAIGTLTGNAQLTMVSVGDANQWKEDLFVHCSEADFFVRDGKAYIGRNNVVEPIPNPEPDSTPVNAFLDMLVDGHQNVAPVECAVLIWDFTHGMLQAARTGSVVRFNPSDFRPSQTQGSPHR